MTQHHTNRRWIVVADGGGARLLALAKDGTSLETLREMRSPDIHRKTHDLVTDRAGRSFESVGPTRHAVEAKTDPHELAKEHFITEVAETLARENQAGSFDDLVLVVTRTQAHTMQAALDEATRAKVRGVVTKDLLKTPNAEIWDRMIEAGLLPPRPTRPALR